MIQGLPVNIQNFITQDVVRASLPLLGELNCLVRGRTFHLLNLMPFGSTTLPPKV